MPSTISGSNHESDQERRSEASPAAPSVARRSAASVIGRIARNVALIVAMLALGYVAGRVHARVESGDARARLQALETQQRAELDRLRTEHQEALKASHAETERVRSEGADAVGLARLYEGYRRTQHVLESLDARNFGTAQTQLREAEKLLAQGATPVEGLQQALDEMSKLDLVIAGNLGQQRQAVAAVVQQLDKVIEAAHVAPP